MTDGSSAPANGRPGISTVHLVYPHGPAISAPHAIGRNLGARLEGQYRVIYHDWEARYAIEPEPDAALVGHPHPRRGTVFERSSRDAGWGRVLMLSPYNGDLAQVAFLDPIIGRCDLYLAITGEFWFSQVGQSACSHWAPKMARLDLAVDRADYPPLKVAFNPPGNRRFVYIGHSMRMKNMPYLGEIARRLPGSEFAWIGPGSRRLPGVTRLGWQDFSSQAGRELIAGFDFQITVGWADANPTTILEAMAWGLIPVCTPQSGYSGVSGITNVPLDDAAGAVAILGRLQAAPETELRRLQRENWEALDRHFSWDRFAAQVTEAIESESSPQLSHEGRLRRLQLSWAAVTSYHTSVPRHALPRAAGRAIRATVRSLPAPIRQRIVRLGHRLLG